MVLNSVNLYTAVDTPARGRVVVCLVCVCLVFVCKYVLGHSRVSQPLNLRLCLSQPLNLRLCLLGPVEIQLSLRLAVSQPITNRLHYSHSDFNKTTKQKSKIGPPADTVTVTSSGITARFRAAAEPSACLFHNPHAKESASTSLDHPCTSH